MELELYNYQTDAIKFILDNINESDVLLAAAPNAGKTIMTAYVIRNFVENNKRVLCSVHGTNVLKRQFYDSVCDIVGYDNVSIYDITDISLYSPIKPVQIMIYQNKKQMEECVEKHGAFDFLIVDEAHKFYENTDSMSIITDNFVKGHHLLLTGSPAIFKDKVDNGEILTKYISASLIESKQPGQYDKEILLDIVSNDVHLSVDDYNTVGEVRKKSEIKLTNNTSVLESVLVGNFGKTIIYVKRQQQANEIKTYLKSKHITTYISHSENDKDSEKIHKFRNNYTGKDNVVLIVVNRATEGFDDPNVSIIDLTYTKNIDTLYQRYSRAIRRRTDATNKRYIKVVPNNGNSADVFTHIMTAVLMLLRQEHYENFNGKNFSIPTFKPDVIRKPSSGVGYVKSYCIKNIIETNDINENNIIIKSSETPVSVRDLVSNTNFSVKVIKDDISYIITDETFDNWQDSLSGEYKIIIEKTTTVIDEDLLLETSLFSGIFFDIKNESYGHVTRYATNKLSDVLKAIHGTSDGYYDNKEGYFKLFRKENIKSGTIWSKKHKTLCALDNIKYHSTPWRLFGQSQKEFVNECYPCNNFYDDKEGYLKLFRDENIPSCNAWKANCKRLRKRDDTKYHTQPWDLFNQSARDFIDECHPNKQGYYTNKHGYFELIINENIISCRDWGNKYKKMCKRDDVKYHSHPWDLFKQSSKDFFAECYNKQDYLRDKEAYFALIRSEKITSSIWSNEYKKLSKRDGVIYHSTPWCLFNQSAKDFFDECYPNKQEYFSNKKGYLELFRKEDITSSGIWMKNYKRLSKRDGLMYYARPWEFFNQSLKDFLAECDIRYVVFDDKEGYFKLFRKENITSSDVWKKNYKRLREKDGLRYHSNPYTFFKVSEKDFFVEYREWLENNPKKEREYKPAYLGEFSEMNKTWNISNSKTTHTRLKEDISEWVKYHELYTNARKNWDEIPYKVIANKIKARPEWIVADFGCGENLLSKEINNIVYAFDHIAIDDTVISCDISHTPLSNKSIDVAVLSLSLMGSNHLDYIKEAYRTLKHMGILIISEPLNRWVDKIDEFQQSIEDIGFTFSIEYSEKFIYITSVKK